MKISLNTDNIISLISSGGIIYHYGHTEDQGENYESCTHKQIIANLRYLKEPQ